MADVERPAATAFSLPGVSADPCLWTVPHPTSSEGREPPVCVDPRPVRALLVDGTIIRVRALDETDAQLVATFYRDCLLYTSDAADE